MSAHGRRIRWNRVIGAFVILITLIFLLAYAISSCGEGNAEESVPESSSTSQGEQSAESSADSQSGDESSNADESVATTKGTTNAPLILGSETTTTTTTTTTADAVVDPNFTEAVQLAADVYNGNLVLVNKENPSHLSNTDLDLVLVARTEGYTNTYAVSYPGQIQISRVVFDAFNKMMNTYETAVGNREIMFNYGYLKQGAANSNAESSCGLDVQLHLHKNNGGYDYISNTGEYTWIYKNMHKFGFVQRYPEGKEEMTGVKGTATAIRYVGIPHAAYMNENGLCLEEYLKLLKEKYTYGKGMLKYSFADTDYSIYYVAASTTEDTKVPVPKSGNYEISGNNVDGYIVTVIS